MSSFLFIFPVWETAKKVSEKRNICVREREKRMRRAGQATSLRRW